ncbi:hypothetical protein ACOMHN_013617 [Nucella lapillus]
MEVYVKKNRNQSQPLGCLGDRRHGVHLFRYLDVALLSQRECRNAYVLVFKVLQGRAKQVPVQEMGSRCIPKEPTPNFDCHLSQTAPRHDETVYMMCSKSQMCVYEYTEDAKPVGFFPSFGDWITLCRSYGLEPA